MNNKNDNFNFDNSSYDTEDIFESNKDEIIDFEEDIFSNEEKTNVTVQNGLIIDNRILNNAKYSNEEENLNNGLSLSENSKLILDDRIKNDSKYDTFNFSGSVIDNALINENIISKDYSKKSNLKSFFTTKRTSIVLPIVAFIFVSILGMYLFVNNTKAETINLIKIIENNKIGYIDNDGTIIARAKYISGTDFYKGFAIVKNNNNLYGIINDKGSLEVPFGNYYYIGLFGNRYVASKFTNNGLKQGLLNEKLEDLTKFKYDSISYLKNGVYLFTRDETMGVLNKDGKEIYTFKVDEIDDRNIGVEISNNETDDKYAKVKVNDSSTIINLSTGREAYSYTLDDINVLDNNVFYIKSKNNNNSTYIVIKDNNIKLKTNKYKRIRIHDLSSSIALAINDDAKIEYINIDNGEIINKNENNNYYYNEGIILENTHDFNKDLEVYNIITKKGIIGTFTNYKPVDNLFYNEMLKINISENKNNFINLDGKLANEKSYETAENFNKNGYSIVSNDLNYGIINKKGNEVIPLTYIEIDTLDEKLFELLSSKYKLNLFIYKDENSKYGLIDSKNKVYVKAIYDNLEVVDNSYPFLAGYYNNQKVLINLLTGKELSVKIDKNDVFIKDNYIIVGEDYYNYNGKLIYTVK